MLAMVMDVDFEVETIVQTYDAAWMAKVQRGEVEQKAIQELAHERWNVAKELQVRLRVVKDAA